MYLDRIVATKKLEVERLRETLTAADAERRIAAEGRACRGFARALDEGRKRSLGLIAEVKKASPSKGLIRADFDPVLLAQAYVEAGTDCLSVLTDREYFQGASEYLTAIRQAVDVPILRKDFTIDPLQIYEARLLGADAVLLIAAILDDAQIKEFLTLSRDLGMDALVEVHDREELERVLKLDADLIGINNRNLHTFVTDLAATEALIGLIPDGKTVVSESGIRYPADIERLVKAGADAVLIGESFMRQPDVGRAVHDLLGASERTGAARP
ncbi:indole-3-glycerol phosphate synthase [Paenibacillus sp. J31TS4]|uniref:indole-3-glycerol phosphate synthase TrpC n=1 Tax=Paenibacillus sp. J31TS4 TaxID=2807195 RepID=UPI001B02D9EA|nr:indole-3-glycerol phosphate synthase TrpC [Paenibacillus sp. J31TS4]GIP37461.1 indole-3-glycerol phosphate synthase [Paenibacillus sp. J31TS4]